MKVERDTKKIKERYMRVERDKRERNKGELKDNNF